MAITNGIIVVTPHSNRPSNHKVVDTNPRIAQLSYSKVDGKHLKNVFSSDDVNNPSSVYSHLSSCVSR